MEHGNHFSLMVGLAVVAGVLYFTGIISGGWAVSVLVGACAVMMMFMTGGMRGRRGGEEHRELGNFADRDR